MPILTQNIKILKSAVMADTTDGGGQMTGVAIVDGGSNNLFPDTSAMDRAFGRVNLRKVFGVAHTTDRDTLMGSHAIITDSPDDPLVHCTLMKTGGWSDDRTAARSVIESYLAKGNKYATRIYETHYAGALQLRVFTFQEAPPPVGGEAIVIRNPNGAEQYVRVLKSTTIVQSIAVVESTTTLILNAWVTTCDLGQALLWDVLGPPAVRVGINEASYAVLYTTVVASGSKFYGVKPLGTTGVPGDLFITTAGGIYTPLVPAATIETPIIDKHPLLTRSALVNTSVAPVSGISVSASVGPGTVFTMPGPITPKTLVVTVGGTAFDDSVSGDGLYQGVTLMASVDYLYGIITFLGTSPSYGTNTCTFGYSPATVTGATSYSVAYDITIANQGLSFTNQFSPPPGPGSFQLSYMAQGRWYTLEDNMVGKLSGSDPSYGVGNLSYLTGSMAVTLGAVPDIGSPLIAQWGDSASATAITVLPTKASVDLLIASDALTNSIVISWSNGGSNYTATSDADGVVTGGGTGQFEGGVLRFSPDVFPSGALTIDYLRGFNSFTSYTAGTNSITFGEVAVTKGSVRGKITLTPSSGTVVTLTGEVDFWDYDGLIVIADDAALSGRLPIGTIDYALGTISLSASVYKTVYSEVPYTGTGWVSTTQLYANNKVSILMDLSLQAIVSYGAGVTTNTAAQFVYTPSFWVLKVPTLDMGSFSTDGVCFTMGGELYTSAAGTLRKGWNPSTGMAGSSVGTVSSAGAISISNAGVPTNKVNTAVWLNAAMNSGSKRVTAGVFRTESAPLKVGVLQLACGALVGDTDDNGDITGTIWGEADFTRGVVKWITSAGGDPAALTYNCVFLQYLPLDSVLLGMDTARLPLDGKVPIYRSGDLVVVHNTLVYTVVNPLVKDTVYDLGRLRLASVRVKDSLGVVVPDTLYVVDLNLGTFMVPTASDITTYVQPLAVEHRIEDMLLCSKADISGELTFTRSLTHNFPATTSFVSSAMPFGDLFSRVYAMFEQATWTNVWQDTLIGGTIIPQFNSALYPVVVTNQGAIKERWLILFTSPTTFRVIGESVGEIGTGNTTTGSGKNSLGVPDVGGTHLAFDNPATATAYFVLPSLGWGAGWSTGNCLRFNTDACGTPFWAVRTVLQGPATEESDQFTLAFRGDVDRP